MSTKLFTLTTLAETVGHWRFQDTLRDISSSGNDLVGTGIDASDFATGYTESGNTVLAIESPDIAIRNAANATDFNMGTSNFTIELIAKASSTIGSEFMQKLFPTDTVGWRIYFENSTGKWVILLDDGTTSLLTKTDASTLNEYQYAAFSVNRATDIAIPYLNGVVGTSVNISTITGSLNNSDDLRLVTAISGPLYDEICITKRALTATEIAARYAGHGDPQLFAVSGSAAVESNIVASNLSSFDLQLRHPCDHVLVDGSFKLSTCPRCNGTGIYFDIRFDQTGHPSILKIEDKLIQSLEKLVLTSENKFHEDIVLGIHDRIGGPIDDMIGIIRYDLIQGIATMKQNQRGVPNLSARAQIATLNKVEVDNDTATSLRYLVEITTVSGETAELTGTIVLAG